MLLANAQSSSDALGGNPAAAEAVGDDGDDDDDEEDDEEGGGASASAGAGLRSSGVGGGASGGASGGAGVGDEEDITAEAEDAVGDMQIAFECLDVARVIYSRIDSPLELARAHLRLGDWYMEEDDFAAAVAEFKACLSLRASRVPNFDRCGVSLAATAVRRCAMKLTPPPSPRYFYFFTLGASRMS